MIASIWWMHMSPADIVWWFNIRNIRSYELGSRKRRLLRKDYHKIDSEANRGAGIIRDHNDLRILSSAFPIFFRTDFTFNVFIDSENSSITPPNDAFPILLLNKIIVLSDHTIFQFNVYNYSTAIGPAEILSCVSNKESICIQLCNRTRLSTTTELVWCVTYEDMKSTVIKLEVYVYFMTKLTDQNTDQRQSM